MGTEAARGDVHRVGRFTLDTARGALLAPGGAEVPLRPKPFALLCHLARNAGRLLSHDEIMEAVWPGIFVTEDSLTLCVRQLRAALDDPGGKLLRTVPRRGYLLAAEAAPEGAAASPAAGLPEGAPTLRLHALELLGDDAEGTRFAAGLTADLATALGRIRWFAMAGAAGAEGAPAAGPRYALRGLLRRAGGGEVRVTVELQREGAQVALWTGSFDAAPAAADPFAQQDRLVAAVAAAAVPALRRAEAERVRALPADRTPTEHEAELRATELLKLPSLAHCGAAWAMLQAALERRPGSPLLLSAAALCRYWYISQGHQAAAEPGAPAERDRAVALAEAAAAGGPDNPVVLMRVALVFSYLQHRDQLGRIMAERALALNPHFSRFRSAAGWVMLYSGEAEASLAHFAEAVRLDSLDPVAGEALAGMAFALLTLGRTEEAVESARRAVALSPERLTSHRALVAALGMAGLPAGEVVAALLARAPRFNLADYLKDRLRNVDLPLFTIAKEGMRRAGVPEHAPDRPAGPPMPPPAGAATAPSAVRTARRGGPGA